MCEWLDARMHTKASARHNRTVCFLDKRLQLNLNKRPAQPLRSSVQHAPSAAADGARKVQRDHAQRHARGVSLYLCSRPCRTCSSAMACCTLSSRDASIASRHTRNASQRSAQRADASARQVARALQQKMWKAFVAFDAPIPHTNRDSPL
jgi:hypothetical protein